MSATLLSQTLWIRHDRVPNWTLAQTALDTMDQHQLEAMIDNYMGDLDYNADTARNLGLGELDVHREAHERLEHALQTFKKWFTDRDTMPSDIDWFRVGPYEIFYVGGMSWGDPPVDESIWDPIMLFSESPAAEAAGFYIE